MKKTLSLILAFLILLTFLSSCTEKSIIKETEQSKHKASSSADILKLESSEGLKFKLNEDQNGYILVGRGTCTESNVIINTFLGLPVTSIGFCAFSGSASLTSVTIADSVKSIDDFAFENCYSLKSVQLGNSLTQIGFESFRNCTSLTEITLPNSVSSLGDGAFYNCEKLQNVILSDSITKIGDNTFQNCDRLKSISLPHKITHIGKNAFRDCDRLREIKLPSEIISIGSHAFYRCQNLSNAEFKSFSGWEASAFNISSDALSDKATAAQYLSATYYSYDWIKK